ncbi:MAG: NAD+ synthase [Thermodesulfobacteriota bacterium]
MGTLRVALAQVNVTVGDIQGNLEKITYWIDKARQAKADVVLVPELALCGYPPEDLLLNPSFLDDIRAGLKELCPRTKGIAAMVGFADRRDNKVYNAAALIHDGTLVDVYHKIELPNYGVFDEKRYFEPGSRCVVCDLNDVRFSLTICEDIWIPGSVCERCVLENRAQVVLNISGSPFYAEKLAKREQIVRRFAAATCTTVVYNNLVGGQDELIFDGGSLIMDCDGTVIARAERFREGLLVTDLAVKEPPVAIQGWNTDGGAPGFHRLDSLAPRGRKPVQPTPVPTMSRTEEIYEALVLGTRDYVAKNGFRKVVIGLSGGIDSSLTAVIAVEALGAENVIGVTMPSQYTSEGTLSDAGILARNLSMSLITIPLEQIFKTYLDVLAKPFGEGDLGVEAENLQARIRGNMIMALSNRFGWLVLTTGNKSEIAVGYCTLYGDTAGGFAVIRDVPKTVVYDLSHYANKKAGRELIPRSVIERAPSAELRPDQTDQDSLPPYEILDPILRAYVEEDRSPEEIYAQGYSPDVVDEVIRMVDRNEYKRRQAPPGIKITPRAFGKDRRFPITNRYPGGVRRRKTN